MVEQAPRCGPQGKAVLHVYKPKKHPTHTNAAGHYEAALELGEKALALDPTNERLQDNLRFYRDKARQPTTSAAKDEL